MSPRCSAVIANDCGAGDSTLSEALVKSDKEPAQLNVTMDSAALDDYMYTCGEWTQELPVGFNEDMGVIIHALRSQVRMLTLRRQF